MESAVTEMENSVERLSRGIEIREAPEKPGAESGLRCWSLEGVSVRPGGWGGAAGKGHSVAPGLGRWKGRCYRGSGLKAVSGYHILYSDFETCILQDGGWLECCAFPLMISACHLSTGTTQKGLF